MSVNATDPTDPPPTDTRPQGSVSLDETPIAPPVEPADRIAELERENARLHRILAREPEVGSFREDPAGGVAIDVGKHPLTFLLIDHLAQMLDVSGAVNYVSIGGWHPKAGRIECIVQRVGKLSPHDAREEAERHLRRAVELLRANGIAWDGPTEFRPDKPDDAPATEPMRPWIVVDFRRTPNALRCLRCGSSVDLPERAPASVLVAAERAFGDAHMVCEEGDDESPGAPKGGE
jgi:hypothetical protein